MGRSGAANRGRDPHAVWRDLRERYLGKIAAHIRQDIISRIPNLIKHLLRDRANIDYPAGFGWFSGDKRPVIADFGNWVSNIGYISSLFPIREITARGLRSAFQYMTC